MDVKLLNLSDTYNRSNSDRLALSVPIYSTVPKLSMIDRAIFDEKIAQTVSTLFEKPHKGSLPLVFFSSNSSIYAKRMESYLIDRELSSSLEIESLQPVVEFVLKEISHEITESRSNPTAAIEKKTRDNYLLSIIDKYIDKLSKQVDIHRRDQELPAIYFVQRLLIRLKEVKSAQTAKEMFHQESGTFAEFKASLSLNQDTYLEDLKKDILSGRWTYNNRLDTEKLSDDQKRKYDAFCTDFFIQRDLAIHTAIADGWKRDQKVQEGRSNVGFTALNYVEEYDTQIRKKRAILNMKIALAAFGVLGLIGFCVALSIKLR